jgi:hypothetical protein
MYVCVCVCVCVCVYVCMLVGEHTILCETLLLLFAYVASEEENPHVQRLLLMLDEAFQQEDQATVRCVDGSSTSDTFEADFLARLHREVTNCRRHAPDHLAAVPQEALVRILSLLDKAVVAGTHSAALVRCLCLCLFTPSTNMICCVVLTLALPGG